jgi:hypothetical protein
LIALERDALLLCQNFDPESLAILENVNWRMGSQIADAETGLHGI